MTSGGAKGARGQAADILIRVRGDETIVVVAQAGEPIEYRVESAARPSRLGAMYAGRVRRTAPALAAAFVDLGDGGADGFLPLTAKRKFREGDAVAVEVVRDAEEGKGPRLAWRPDPKLDPDGAAKDGPVPRLMRPAPALGPRMVRDWPGAVGRIVADDVDTLLAVKAFCRDHRPELLDRIARFAKTGDMFESEGIADRLEELLAPWVALPSGGRINIQPTPALVAIDVDSGRDAGGASVEDTARRVNAEAAREIVRQLRLRGLAGLIVAGFLPLPRAADRARVLAILKQGAQGDPNALTVGGFTRFGLVEMIRARTRAGTGASPARARTGAPLNARGDSPARRPNRDGA